MTGISTTVSSNLVLRVVGFVRRKLYVHGDLHIIVCLKDCALHEVPRCARDDETWLGESRDFSLRNVVP